MWTRLTVEPAECLKEGIVGSGPYGEDTMGDMGS
jgi:hypothetical protein